MKNLAKLFGIIALVTVIGFSTAACNKDGLNGTTWEATYGGMSIVLTFNSPNFSMTGGGQTQNGTYTVSSRTVTMTTDSESTTATLSGNTLSLEGIPFTKQ